jgi:serine O-acetyltransferase
LGLKLFASVREIRWKLIYRLVCSCGELSSSFLYRGSLWSLRERVLRTSGNKKDFLYAIYNKRLERCGSWIGLNASFAGEPSFPHGPFGIFISQGAKIGKNCVLFQQVTIGSNTLNDSKGRGAPSIGDNCYIGAGAKIIGNVRIGHNVRVGANCVVVKDIPDNASVVCQQSRVIANAYRENEFLQWNEER